MGIERLPPIRIGFDYSIGLGFPAGFLAAGESVRGKLRKFAGGPEVAQFTSSRLGDEVTLSLLTAQTAAMKPGEHLLEPIIYKIADPGDGEIPLTDNLFIISADYSPSE